jgi:hypothetical protein
MEFLKTVAFCVLVAVLYGELHDQITAHLCVQYFSVGHPDIFHTASPFLLAVGWGFVATWWVGAGLGIPLAALMRWGSPPRLKLADVLGAIAILALAMAVCALCAGMAGYWSARSGVILPPDDWAPIVSRRIWPGFLADLWAHRTSYLIGIVGGLGVMVYAVSLRVRRAGAGFWPLGSVKG